MTSCSRLQGRRQVLGGPPAREPVTAGQVQGSHDLRQGRRRRFKRIAWKAAAAPSKGSPRQVSKYLSKRVTSSAAPSPGCHGRKWTPQRRSWRVSSAEGPDPYKQGQRKVALAPAVRCPPPASEGRALRSAARMGGCLVLQSPVPRGPTLGTQSSAQTADRPMARSLGRATSFPPWSSRMQAAQGLSAGLCVATTRCPNGQDPERTVWALGVPPAAIGVALLVAESPMLPTSRP